MKPKRIQLNARAQEILANEIVRLSTMSYSQIAQWSDFPKQPNIELQVPEEMSEYKFCLMKDVQPDKSIRVAIQVHRNRFLGIGWVIADGFFITPDGYIRKFTEQDVWAVT